jgi:hypothetical protein
VLRITDLKAAFLPLSTHGYPVIEMQRKNQHEYAAKNQHEYAAASGIPVRTGSPQLLLNPPGDFSGLANTHGACAWNYRNRGNLYGKARSISRTGAQFCPWASIETCPPC